MLLTPISRPVYVVTSTPHQSLSHSEITQLESRYELDFYPKRDLSIVRGDGAVLYDVNGNSFIDCAAGVGVANVGHANPVIIEAIHNQAQQLITCPEIFHNNIRAQLLHKLIHISPDHLERAFLCNSGTEATEAAVKLARYSTGRTEIITMMRGFHGRTMGSLSASFDKKIKEPFAPLLDGFTFVPFNNINRLEQAINDDTAAIMMELIQGNGGVHIAESEYMEQVQQLCREHDILLIIDEVQTGFARTGTMFASEQYNIEPDIICLAKAIAGGIPMGAILCSDGIKAAKNLHGSTFGGNPLACAAALANIDFIESNHLASHALKLGEYFVSEMSKHEMSKIRDIRQKGLMIGIELRIRVYPILLQLLDEGITALPAGSTVLRLLPPLVIQEDQIDRIVQTLVDLLK